MLRQIVRHLVNHAAQRGIIQTEGTEDKRSAVRPASLNAQKIVDNGPFYRIAFSPHIHIGKVAFGVLITPLPEKPIENRLIF